MIIPCIDLMDGKAVQLVQGKEKVIEIEDIDGLLERFQAFPVIHVIDLDAAKGVGSNLSTVLRILKLRKARVGGGVRSVDRADELVGAGAEQVIVGTSAFSSSGVNQPFLEALAAKVSASKICVALDSLGGKIVVKGWQESLLFSASELVKQLEPYCGSFLCTYVDAEGTMLGSDLEWFRDLQAITPHRIIAAGGFSALAQVGEATQQGLDVALGMAIYTGALDLEDLLRLSR